MEMRERLQRSFMLSKFTQEEINIPFHVIEQFEYQEVKEFSSEKISFCWFIGSGEEEKWKTKGKMWEPEWNH